MRPSLLSALVTSVFVVGFAFATDLTEEEIAKLTPQQTKILAAAEKQAEKYVELLEAGKSRDALPIGQKVLTAHEQTIGKEHPRTAQWTAEIGSKLFEIGEYQAAKDHFDRALAAQQKKLGDEHEETLLTLQYLGEYHLFYSHDLAAAKKLFDDVLRVRLKTLGEKDEDTASVLNDLGLWADAVGDHQAARDYYARCLTIRRELLGNESEEVATTLSNLSLAEMSAADYLASRDHQEEALKIRRKVLGDNSADTGDSLNNLGLVQQTLGDLVAARQSFEEAQRIMREVHGEKHDRYAKTLMNLAALLLQESERGGPEKLAAAEKFVEQALTIQEETLGKEHPDTAGSLLVIAGIKVRRDQWAAAEPIYLRAKEILVKHYGEDSTHVAALLWDYSELQRLQGRLEESRKSTQAVYKIARRKLGDDKFDTAMLRCEVGFAAAVLGEWPAALAHIDAGRRVVRQVALEILPGLPDRELLKCLKENDTDLWHAALTCGLLQRDDPAWCEKSAAWLVNGKALAQEVFAQQTLLARESKDPQLAAAVNELLSIRRQLAALGVLQPGKNDEDDHRAQLDALETQERDLSKRIARSRPELKGSHWSEIDDLRKKLPADATFVNFVRLRPVNLQPKTYADRFQDERYLAWLIPASGAGEIKIVDLGLASEVDELIKKVSAAVSASVAGDAWAKRGEVETAKQTQASLQALSRRVLAPLTPHLGERTTLLLSPDSRLWLAPWQALPLEDGRFAIEKYRFRFLLSGRELTAAATAAALKSTAFIFADPSYDLLPAAAESSLKAMFGAKYQPPAGEGGKLRSLETAAKMQAVRLPGTAAEARAIQPALEVFTHTKPIAYTDQYALEGVFKKLNQPRVLVLSTHGFFHEDQAAAGGAKWSGGGLAASGKPLENPLLRCGLLLAGCNQPRNDGGDDGVLTGLEIVGADLRGTELVVLSACETGLGKVNDGDGVAGLRQAFQLAGARSVVASLWQVPDRDSALLMSDFFSELAAGKTKDEALRRAQIKRIQSRRERYGAAHPFFWAAWTLTGE